MLAPPEAPTVVLLILAVVALCAGAAGCSDGTTPVCDDAGSCLIVPGPGDEGGVEEASGGDGGGDAGDGAAGDSAAE